jgi:hypothetical protein
VTASGPYIDSFEKDKLERKESKKDWISSRNFTAVVGKATMAEPPGSRAGIVRASGPYSDGGVKFRDLGSYNKKTDPYGRRGWQ